MNHGCSSLCPSFDNETGRKGPLHRGPASPDAQLVQKTGICSDCGPRTTYGTREQTDGLSKENPYPSTKTVLVKVLVKVRGFWKEKQYNHLIILHKNWRRDRDSNPRNRKRFNRFRVCRLRPLGHLSWYVSYRDETEDALSWNPRVMSRS
jgi:hypothetical protein